MCRKLLSAGLIIALFIPAVLVFASDIEFPTSRDGNIVASKAEYSDDLYVAGGNVTVDSAIAGDLFSAGGTVSISGSVGQDLTAAGGTLTVLSAINGDARLTGGTITLNNAVNEDVLAAGGTLTLTEKSRVGRDLWAAGGSIVLNGEVAGSVSVAGEEVLINGPVRGTLRVMSDKLIFGPKSVVLGSISYKGRKDAVIQEGAQVSAVQFEKAMERRGGGRVFAVFLSIAFLINLLGWIIAGLIVVKFFGKTLRGIGQTAHDSPWKSFGIGFLGMVAIPAAIVALFMTIVGYYLALALIAWFGFVIIVTCLASALVLGSMLMGLMKKSREMAFNWQSVVLGVFILLIVRWVPYIGWGFAIVLFLVTFGSLLQMLGKQIKEIHMEK